MFETIRVQNLQSHEDTFLKLHPNVNVLLGDSQSGKTAFGIRALLLLSKNRPRGARFYSNFAPKKGTTIVKVVTGEGNTLEVIKTVERKGKKKTLKNTEYLLDGKPYSAVGSGVPDVIRSALNLSDINVQEYFDTPFLATSSSIEVARVINRITGIADLDGLVSTTNKDLAELNTQIKTVGNLLKDETIKLSKYDPLESVKILLGKVDLLDEKIDALDLEEKALLQSIKDWDRATAVKGELSKLLEIEISIDDLEARQNKVLSTIDEKVALLAFVNLSEDVSLMGPAIADIEELIGYFESSKNQSDELNAELVELKKYLILHNAWAKLQNNFASVMNDYSIEVAAMDKCPTCFGPIDEKARGRMKDI